MKEKFYFCKGCNAVLMSMDENPGECCANELQELIPGTVDASREKHVPQYEVRDSKVFVNVGSVSHPMTQEHYIPWVCLYTNQGCQMKRLSCTDKPELCFALSEGEKVEAVYAYCNLHGLWKS